MGGNSATASAACAEKTRFPPSMHATYISAPHEIDEARLPAGMRECMSLAQVLHATVCANDMRPSWFLTTTGSSNTSQFDMSSRCRTTSLQHARMQSPRLKKI